LVASLHVVRIHDAAVVERVGAPQVSGFKALGFGTVIVADGLEFFVDLTAVILHGHVVSHLSFCIVHVQIGSFALCGSPLFGLLNLLVVGRQVPFGDPDFVEVSLGLVGAEPEGSLQIEENRTLQLAEHLEPPVVLLDPHVDCAFAHDHSVALPGVALQDHVSVHLLGQFVELAVHIVDEGHTGPLFALINADCQPVPTVLLLQEHRVEPLAIPDGPHVHVEGTVVDAQEAFVS